MDAAFWHGKWRRGEIGFHRDAPNPAIERHLAALGLAQGGRVFLPLCGKTLDIGWLLQRGHPVAGVELSALAVGQLFEALGVEPRVERAGGLDLWRGPGVEIHVGDVFALDRAALGPVAAVYDRAALVALPAALRARYAAHVIEATGGAPQLVVAYEHAGGDAGGHAIGPPFSVEEAELHALYGGRYRLTLLERREEMLRGAPAAEAVWLMTPAEEARG